MTSTPQGGASRRKELSRRSLLLGAAAAALPVGGLVVHRRSLGGDGAPASTTAAGPPGAALESNAVTIDLTEVIARTDAFALGLGCSTYGATPVTSPQQATAERRLDARSVRLPVGWRSGRLASSATGGPDGLDVRALVDTYRSWGWRVLVVLGGRTTDGDLSPGDAGKIVRALGHDMVEYSTPNEPDVGGGLEATLATATRICAEGAQVVPGFRVWGPALAYYDADLLQRFATAQGQRLAGLDYHHYGMGETGLPTDAVLEATPTWGREVRALRLHLEGQGLPAQVAVGEVNLSWRYVDGTPQEHGGWMDPVNGRLSNRRFFTSVNTVFIASVCGHVLQAGGRVLPYATQDRALGMTVQSEYDGNPDDRPTSSPMPAYWGVAAWTGATTFPHFGERFYAVSVDPLDSRLEVFAVDNERGGVNVIVIDKHASGAREVTLRVVGRDAHVVDGYRTDPDRPYEPYRHFLRAHALVDGRLTLEVTAMTVTVLVLSD